MSASLTTKGQKRAPFLDWGEMSAYVQDHCPTCIYGWMRMDKTGKVIAVCTLDRATITPYLEFCDRFEEDPERVAIYETATPLLAAQPVKPAAAERPEEPGAAPEA